MSRVHSQRVWHGAQRRVRHHVLIAKYGNGSHGYRWLTQGVWRVSSARSKLGNVTHPRAQRTRDVLARVHDGHQLAGLLPGQELVHAADGGVAALRVPVHLLLAHLAAQQLLVHVRDHDRHSVRVHGGRTLDLARVCAAERAARWCLLRGRGDHVCWWQSDTDQDLQVLVSLYIYSAICTNSAQLRTDRQDTRLDIVQSLGHGGAVRD